MCPVITLKIREFIMLKSFIKRCIRLLPFDLTRNMRYDRLTRQIIERYCHHDSNTVDVGCHKGEILDILLGAAPDGRHFAFEPIPVMHRHLVSKYAAQSNCQIFDIALSNENGETTFNYVESNPSYSGILRRKYDRPNEVVQQIKVQTKKLDDIIPEHVPIRLIKLDIEGAEYNALCGARNVLKRDRPLVVFEFGLGAADVYGVTPEKMIALFDECDMGVFLMEDFMRGRPHMTKDEFSRQFNQSKNFNFIAAAKSIDRI